MAQGLRFIDASGAAAAVELAALRERLSPRGDVASPESRRKTQEVFGAPLAPREVVEKICREVRERGVDAVLEYGRKLDRAELDATALRVPAEELTGAHAAADPEFLAAVRRIVANIRRFQSAILAADVRVPLEDGELGLHYKPVRRVGICIPGGAAAYPSTLLMTAVPAQVAGVAELAVMAPPTPFGAYNRDLLAVCHELGVREVYRMGGAQGVAALAYGVDGVPAVDMIVGPGSLFVALAKQHVAGVVGIDMLAGPTEVVIVADGSVDPDFLAADLISQAEHSPGASILLAWDRAYADRVADAIEPQLARLARGDLARASLAEFGAIVLVADEAAASELANELAAEHLQLAVADPRALLPRIRNAGAVFLGANTPVAIGDYHAGPSHTLPTGGAARFSSALSANAFRKAISVIEYGPKELRRAADDVRRIAAVEGLTAHSESVDIRLRKT
ncbi:MAG TPA: histidinol dehydrogenase [Planctomycetia bacterium]|nr:histidinol dehydrogenase [Planctomycetia bacterium]